MKLGFVSGIALVALATLSLAWVRKDASAAAPAPIKIGVGGPMTGTNAVFGAQMRNGVEQAVRDINAGGGILNRKLSIEIGDDAGDPKQGAALAKKFVADHVSFVIGHFNLGASLPASSIYADNNILDITPAATNPQMTERGLRTVFRTCGRDDQQAGVAAKFLAGRDTKRIAIVHDKTTYGEALAEATRKELAGLGLKEVLYDGVDRGEKDYSSLITKLKTANVDVIYWSGPPSEAALIIKQMRDQGVAAFMLASDAIAGDTFTTIGGDAIEGTYMTFPSDPRDRPEAAKAVSAFKAKSIDPETYTLYAYAAVEIIKQAAEQAKSLDPIEIAKLMHSGPHFATVLGDISFDTKGDITRPDYTVFIWKKGSDGKISYNPLQP